jgi:hypothetical protein
MSFGRKLEGSAGLEFGSSVEPVAESAVGQMLETESLVVRLLPVQAEELLFADSCQTELALGLLLNPFATWLLACLALDATDLNTLAAESEFDSPAVVESPDGFGWANRAHNQLSSVAVEYTATAIAVESDEEADTAQRDRNPASSAVEEPASSEVDSSAVERSNCSDREVPGIARRAGAHPTLVTLAFEPVAMGLL